MRMVRREMALWKPKAVVERPLMKLGGLIKPKWRKVAPPVGAKIVEMSPVDFLSKVPSPCGEGRTAFEDLAREECWSKSSVNFIMGKVERGEELEPPMLDYTRMFRGFPSHEGRHTAYVAYKLGVERMPVIVYGTPQSSNPQTVEVKPKLSLSGLCHTLTLDEYDVLYDLDYFYRLYPGQYVSLIWLARKYQDRHEEKYGKRTYVLKECIDEVRRILERLWRKGMVQPEAITVKTYDRVVLVRPETKEEAFKAEERWRITLAGHDCINPPEPVKECIKAEIEKEERETGKVTPMKAFCECWKKYET
jgi:hypothetical protein